MNREFSRSLEPFHSLAPPVSAAQAREALRGVERHMETFLEARALALALRWGWIDGLSAGPAALSDLAKGAVLPPRAAELMHSLLIAGAVVQAGEPISLTPSFRRALAWRDLLEAKLWFAEAAADDVHAHLDLLLTDVPAFMNDSKVFELFRYDRCMDVTDENLALTRRWVAYTTTLTRYEAPACWERVDLSGARSLLDVGGNSGEFARQACAIAPHLRATVFDLPVVCALGREHLAGTPEGARIDFVAGDLRRDELPGKPDLVSFKSLLHDWPDDYARAFLAKAMAVLPPGGRLLIFERGPIPADGTRLSHAMEANLIFVPFFREMEFYLDVIAELEMAIVTSETVALEMPFHLIVAEKPS